MVCNDLFRILHSLYVLHYVHRLLGSEPLDPLVHRETKEPPAYPASCRIRLNSQNQGDTAMRYTRLATYDVVKGTFPELVGLAEKGILPIFIASPASSITD